VLNRHKRVIIDDEGFYVPLTDIEEEEATAAGKRHSSLSHDGATIHVLFSDEREAERDAEEAEVLAEKPMNDWLKEISAMDGDMPRTLEDVIDVLSVTARGNLAIETKDKYDSKKAKRDQKP